MMTLNYLEALLPVFGPQRLQPSSVAGASDVKGNPGARPGLADSVADRLDGSSITESVRMPPALPFAFQQA